MEDVKVEQDVSLCMEEAGEGRNTGYWSIHENLLYSIFIDHHKLTMISRKKRKKVRIFDQMSKFVGSRNSLQCRSHHQKLVQKLGELKLVIEAFKKYFGQERFRQQKRLLIGKTAKRTKALSLPQVKNEAQDECVRLFHNESSGSSSQAPSGGEEEEKKCEMVPGVGPLVVLPCKAEAMEQFFPFCYYINNSIVPIELLNQHYPTLPTNDHF